MRIDWFTFAAQLINFLVLLYLLKRFLYAPITSAMQRREAGIAAQLAEADQKQAEAEEIKQHYLLRSEHLEEERHRMMEEMKTEVEQTRRQLVDQARLEIDHRRQDWLASLSRDQATLSQLIRQRCSQQVTAATRQAMRELADADLEEQMTRTFIQRLNDQGVPGLELVNTNGSSGATVHTAFALSPTWQDRLRSALSKELKIRSIEFRVMPEIACGIEVLIGSHKIGWSVEEYLATLEQEFSHLVKQPAI